MKQRKHQDADQRHADGVAQIGILDALEYIFRRGQPPHETRGGNAHDRAKQRIKPERDHRRRLMAERRQQRDGESRLRSEKPVADKGRGSRCQRDGEESAHAHFRQHQFDGEHDAADWRVEGRRDAGAGAGRDQRNALPRLHDDELADAGAERRANLDNRPFAADRRAGTDRKCRGDRFDDGDDRPDDAFLVIDRVHDFWDAVAACFRREIRNQRRDHHAADDRRQDDESAPRPGRREYIGVVMKGESAKEKQIMNRGNESAEEYRAETGDEVRSRAREMTGKRGRVADRARYRYLSLT